MEMVRYMDFGKFVNDRIAQLRTQMEVSEKQMSRDIDKDETYLATLRYSNSTPSLKTLKSICDYFGISLMDFFDAGNKYPIHIQQLLDEAKKSEVEEIELTTEILKRFHGNKWSFHV